MDTNALTSRLMRVLRFDASVYREIAADQGALPQALTIVVIAVILYSIPSFVAGQGAAAGIVLVALGIIGGLIGFGLYSAVAAFIAKTFFQGKTEFQEMARTLGFAYAWQAVGILGFIPILGGLIAFVGWIGAVVSGLIALRESAEFDTVKALITVVIAAIVAGFATFCATGIIGTPIILALGLASGG